MKKVTKVTKASEGIACFFLAFFTFVAFVTFFTFPLRAQDQQSPPPKEAPAAEAPKVEQKKEEPDLDEFTRPPRRRFMPYYRFEFGEGFSVPTKGDFFASHEVASQVGSLFKATDKIKLFGLYDLTYEGPGLMRAEGRLFTERAIRHSFVFEPSMEVESVGVVRLKGFVINEKRRSGTNEIWGQGLYDYQARGFSLIVERDVLGFKLSPAFRLTAMEFPNFTDLLREFQQADLTAELSGGLMDQNVYAVSLGVSRRPFNLGASVSVQKYKNERIIGSAGSYLGEKQKDTVTEFTGDFATSLWRFSFVPQGAFRMKRSNQNYLRFEFFGDTSPDFIENNYDYNEYSLGGKVFLNLTSSKALYGSMDLNNRTYTTRPPRTGTGVYELGKKQNTVWGAWGGGVQWKVTDYSTWNLGYHLVFSQSNMKQEKFIPYNYTGHVIGLYFTVAP
ncbi:MAG: hypothetical protein HY401_08845 [Elusimicrobia bacterium]|nr:hypothetical protein [Elusimicrobiota bacterium]